MENNNYRTLRYLILPMSKREKEKRASHLQGIVDYFKPKIEEKINKNTGLEINLGEINVKPSLRKYNKSISYGAYIERVDGKIKDTIYFTTNLLSRGAIYFNKGYSTHLDYFVMAHELGHMLWSNLEKQNELFVMPSNSHWNKDKEDMWLEGFATFCAYKYFKELYPQDIAQKIEFEPKSTDDLINELKEKKIGFQKRLQEAMNIIYTTPSVHNQAALDGLTKVDKTFETWGEVGFMCIPRYWRIMEGNEKEAIKEREFTLELISRFRLPKLKRKSLP